MARSAVRAGPGTRTRSPARSEEGHAESESLKDQARNSLDEARMVLPGIQAVFGFQLIAIFNTRFADLTYTLQVAHLASLLLIVTAIALIMTPAAYDRIAESDRVTTKLIRHAARLLTAAMAALGAAIGVEVWVVCIMVLGNPGWSGAIGALCVAMFLALWFVGPWRARAARTRR